MISCLLGKTLTRYAFTTRSFQTSKFGWFCLIQAFVLVSAPGNRPTGSSSGKLGFSPQDADVPADHGNALLGGSHSQGHVLRVAGRRVSLLHSQVGPHGRATVVHGGCFHVLFFFRFADLVSFGQERDQVPRSKCQIDSKVRWSQ